MLTRLKVSGFKNLVDVDVRFGPFTCIAGANGVGKSNLFDAICFLSALTDLSLIQAARSIRSHSERGGDIRGLFHRVGDTCAAEMSFEAEMIVPQEGTDDLGQRAKATTTFLKYSLVLAYRQDENRASLEDLEIRREELTHITQNEAHKHLPPHKPKWRRSAVTGRRVAEFISTVETREGKMILLHQDGGPGRARPHKAADLPRTVLSSTNAVENPTALLARREMQSWRLLQLEPSALREPNDFSDTADLGANGSNLPATLYRLARHGRSENGRSSQEANAGPDVYAPIANRLAELIDDVREIYVDRDEKRELLTLYATDSDKTPFAARSLSDGTLRFLALAVLDRDPHAKGVLCLEEPENGIHPERIPAMLQLLQDVAVDPTEALDDDNPLRQVIVNTHSPAVVLQVPDDSLMVVERVERVQDGRRFKAAMFSCLPNTWRVSKPQEQPQQRICPKGKLLSYLRPVLLRGPTDKGDAPALTRVIDREDYQQFLPHPFFSEPR